MANGKRFYWLKLKEDFFDEKYIKALRRLPQGDSLAIVYLKMQLKSLKTEGIIKYEGVLPDSISELALALGENENVVRLAVEALVRFGVVERWDDETLYMSAMQQLIGSESDSAERVRKHRALHGNTSLLQSNVNVTLCNTEIENKRKEVDKEKDIENTEVFCAEPEAVSAPPVISIILNDRSYFDVTNDDVLKWEKLYPAVNILQELRKMAGWCDSNPTKRKTRRGVRAFITSWLAKEQDRGGSACTREDRTGNIFLEMLREEDRNGQK